MSQVAKSSEGDGNVEEEDSDSEEDEDTDDSSDHENQSIEDGPRGSRVPRETEELTQDNPVASTSTGK